MRANHGQTWPVATIRQTASTTVPRTIPGSACRRRLPRSCNDEKARRDDGTARDTRQRDPAGRLFVALGGVAPVACGCAAMARPGGRSLARCGTGARGVAWPARLAALPAPASAAQAAAGGGCGRRSRSGRGRCRCASRHGAGRGRCAGGLRQPDRLRRATRATDHAEPAGGGRAGAAAWLRHVDVRRAAPCRPRAVRGQHHRRRRAAGHGAGVQPPGHEATGATGRVALRTARAGRRRLRGLLRLRPATAALA